MSNTPRVAAVALGMALVAVPGVAAATPASVLDPAADHFMEAICPAEWWGEQVNKSWDRAFDRHRIKYGTPIPRYLRLTFRKAGRAHSTTAAELRAQEWPEAVTIEVRSVAKYYATAGRYLSSRDTKKVSRSWLPASVIWRDPTAFRRIANALELPNSCRPYY